MGFDIENAIRLSLKFSELVPLRDHIQPFSVPYGRTKQDDYSGRFIPIHLLTHMDLPWHEDKPADAIEFNFKPRLFNSIILDFSYKQEVLNGFLLKDTSGIFSNCVSYVDFSLITNGEIFYLLNQELLITLDEFKKALEQSHVDLKETFVLIRTDWSFRFNRFSVSFNNPALEGLAAFLCHPYLDKMTVEWLVSSGMYGLGHDLPSLENPLIYAQGGDVHPFVKQAREITVSANPSFGEKVFSNQFLKLKEVPVQGEVSRFYIKNLNFTQLDNASRESFNKSRYTKGSLLVIPIPVLQDAHGVACETFFIPD